MKSLRAVALAVILAAFPILLLAADNANKKSITVNEPVAVGSTVLQPGNYRVEWNDTGSTVQVSFKQGSKTLATAPATVQKKKTGFDRALDLREGQNGQAKSLTAINFKNEALIFDQGMASQSH